MARLFIINAKAEVKFHHFSKQICSKSRADNGVKCLSFCISRCLSHFDEGCGGRLQKVAQWGVVSLTLIALMTKLCDGKSKRECAPCLESGPFACLCCNLFILRVEARLHHANSANEVPANTCQLQTNIRRIMRHRKWSACKKRKRSYSHVSLHNMKRSWDEFIDVCQCYTKAR